MTGPSGTDALYYLFRSELSRKSNFMPKELPTYIYGDISSPNLAFEY